MVRSYRSGVDAAVLGPGHDVSGTAQEKTVSECLVLGTIVAVEDGSENLQLGGLELHRDG